MRILNYLLNDLDDIMTIYIEVTTLFDSEEIKYEYDFFVTESNYLLSFRVYDSFGTDL